MTPEILVREVLVWGHGEEWSTQRDLGHESERHFTPTIAPFIHEKITS